MKLHLLASGLGIALLGQPAIADWSHLQGPDYNGHSTEKNLPCTTLDTLWTANAGTGFSGIAVSGGRAFTMGNTEATDSVLCFDSETGRELWRHSYPEKLAPKIYEGGPNAMPTVDGDRVYTISKNGRMLCLNTQNGTVIWEVQASAFGIDPPDWGFAGAPTVLGDTIFYNAGESGLALNKQSGVTVWSSPNGPAGYGPLIPYSFQGKTLLMTFTGLELMAVEAATGSVAWRLPSKASYDINAVAPIVFGSKVYVSTGYRKGGSLYDFSSGSAEQTWSSKDLSTQFSTPYLIDGHIYGIHGNSNQRARLVCLNAATGETVWENPAKFGSLRYADSKLFMLEDGGDLVVGTVSPQGFTEIKRRNILSNRCWTAPTISNGRLYARDAQGVVVCVNLR